ncbi:B-type cyclin [Seminavis robusta]|uniref:B-type cyclin n=1 Tax=Seminavis robusta TaxID=568900 RepID=A0A9N8HKS9_9STRA|nr:B-type cyclin [Seminavis robusta]|eukprot:Sro969_g226160.1 B-type cyclin (372) ;mRNA; r:7900-9334
MMAVGARAKVPISLDDCHSGPLADDFSRRKRPKLREIQATRRRLKCRPPTRNAFKHDAINVVACWESNRALKRPIMIEAWKKRTQSVQLPMCTPSPNVCRSNADPKRVARQLVDDHVDVRDSDNAIHCTEYANDIYESHRKRELVYSEPTDSLDSNSQIRRSKVIDWMVKVHMDFRLGPEVLYVAVALLNRYTARSTMPSNELDLVALACMWIAIKVEETFSVPPDLWISLCKTQYTKADLVQTEKSILKLLDFEIALPTAYHFLVRFLKLAHADKKMLRFSFYYLDSTLLSGSLLIYLPSEIAAACVYLARLHVGKYGWSPTLLKYSRYSEEDVGPVARAIIEEHRELENELNAVRRKYRKSFSLGAGNS